MHYFWTDLQVVNKNKLNEDALKKDSSLEDQNMSKIEPLRNICEEVHHSNVN